MIYIGLFVVAFATLAFEVTLVRLMNVVTWYHLAFFAISTAMLGMTAGAATVYLRKSVFDSEKRGRALSRACLWFALSVPGVLIYLCIIPLATYPSILCPIVLLLTTAICSVPFYFSGIVITTSLTRFDLPIGRLYASDLIGAALGCFMVLGGLQILDAPSLILICGGFGCLAGVFYAKNAGETRQARTHFILFLLFLGVGYLNSLTPYGIRPILVKGGYVESIREVYKVKWNSFSRVVVYGKEVSPPTYWGRSPKAPAGFKTPYYNMNVNGMAATSLNQYQSKDDIDFLRYDVTNIGYHLGRTGPACVIGVGGGRDIQSALLFGLKPVDGVDINPIFINLLKEDMKTFAGLGNNPDVNLIVDDGRSFVTQSKTSYSVIQMALVDTFAATSAGAFSLSENSLYTLEAWKVFIDRLQPDGIFMVSRWFSPSNLGETGRILSLAVATLLEKGVENPKDHIALITCNNVSTLVMSPSPFSPADVKRLREVGTEKEFIIAYLPGKLPEDKRLASILESRSESDLDAAVASSKLNYEPPTDNNPYFFNMLKLSYIPAAFRADPGSVKGNLTATLTLMGLLAALAFLAVATVIVPLVVGTRKNRAEAIPRHVFWSGAMYFSLIGSAFMLVEIAMIQRLSVFLGHPIYALGVLLSGLILSSGFGSLLSDRLPLTRAPWCFAYPLITAGLILTLPTVFNTVLYTQSAEPIMTKILIALAVVAPLGLFMGFFFPAGMRLVGNVCQTETPWYWALNGIFGVLCSALAVMISIYSGITTNIYIGAALYACVSLVVPVFARRTAS